MKRIIHPGEEWMYFRLYTGPETADAWLANTLPYLLNELENEKLSKKCFFLRYADASFHLRIRLELINCDFFGSVLKIFRKYSEEMYNEGLIWKTEIGSYDRELERYGEDWIETAEQIFSFDSKFWLGILSLLREDVDGENKRWRAALLSAHGFFNDFGTTIESRIELLHKIVAALSSEIGGGKKLRLQIDEKYRNNRTHLERMLASPSLLEIPDFSDIMKHRSNLLAGLSVRESVKSWGENIMQNRVSDIIHLSLNRGLRSKHRMQELVIYSFLKQLYISAEARG